ncbi:MAG: hypothetical protein KFW07_00240 [Mycoplasmataceae bacterium]|nr:hypothetical protein [Mycoplasmataceae bacterium]
MKKQKKISNSIIEKQTRQYTCTRRINKEGKRIWVVLEEGRKFYRIFPIRSLGINYFIKLKTIYAEMLVQDLTENIFTTIFYTKLETMRKGLKDAMVEIKGSVVENSDQLFDEDNVFVDAMPSEKKDNTDNFLDKILHGDFSFVDKMFPKQKPLIEPVLIPKPLKGIKKTNQKIIGEEFGITFYQSDIDLSFFLMGDEFFKEQEKPADE